MDRRLVGLLALWSWQGTGCWISRYIFFSNDLRDGIKEVMERCYTHFSYIYELFK